MSQQQPPRGVRNKRKLSPFRPSKRRNNTGRTVSGQDAGHRAGQDADGSGQEADGSGHRAGPCDEPVTGQDVSGHVRSKPGGGDGDRNGSTGGEHENTVKNRKRQTKASFVTLAHTYSEEKHGALVRGGGWRISEKFDGVRFHVCLDTNRILSRTGKPFSVPKGILDEIWKFRTRFDGEFFISRGKFQETISVVRKTTNTNEEEWGRILFMIFDIQDPTRNFDERLAILHKVIPADHPFLKVVEQTHVTADTDLDAMLAEFEGLGAEGLMLRKVQDGGYTFARTDNLLKIKSFHSCEAKVLALEKGKGKHSNRLGQILCETPEKRSFRVGSGFTDAERENPPCKVGDIVTYRYFEKHSKTGVPRFPTWVGVRTDVDPADLGFVSL